MSESKKEYWKPSVSADVVAVNVSGAPWREDGSIVDLILVKRSAQSEAFPNCWALPGGFLNKGESLEQCAVRELKEETGLEAKNLIPVGVFSAPDRDPRDQVISSSFLSFFMSLPDKPLELKVGDDATEVRQFKIKGTMETMVGTMNVALKCAETGDRIEFSVRVDRGRYGLPKLVIEYKNGEGFSRLAFDHAEILARAIMKAPDIILQTKTKPIFENAERKDSKKELAAHLSAAK